VSPAVRTFYKGWRTNPYFARGKFGGLFALSADGAARVFPLPEVTADDEYIRRSFVPARSPSCPPAASSRARPRTLASLLRVRRRSLRGAREVSRMGKASPERGSARAMMRRAVTSPADTLPIAFFLVVTLWVRVSLIFDRDTSAPAGNAT
jgi:hypothetical protein